MQYYVRFKGKRIGPLDRGRIDQLISRGQLTAHHEIAGEDGQWQRIGQWRAEQAAPKSEPADAKDLTLEEPGGSSEGAPKSVSGGDPQWYVAIDGQQSGPHDEASLGKMIQAGRVVDSTMVWRESMDSWQRADAVFPGVLAKLASVSSPDPTEDSVVEQHFGTLVFSHKPWIMTLAGFYYFFMLESFSLAALLFYYSTDVKTLGDIRMGPAVKSVILCVSAVLLGLVAICLTRVVLGMSKNRVAGELVDHRACFGDLKKYWIAMVVLLVFNTGQQMFAIVQLILGIQN